MGWSITRNSENRYPLLPGAWTKRGCSFFLGPVSCLETIGDSYDLELDDLEDEELDDLFDEVDELREELGDLFDEEVDDLADLDE